MNEEEECELCGAPMPKGEEMFRYHGHSGPCPRPPMGPRTTIRDNTLKCGICSHSEQEFIDLKAALAAKEAFKEEVEIVAQVNDWPGYSQGGHPAKYLNDTIAELQARVKALEWRSVYPTTEGYWWHKGPCGTLIRRVRMAEIGYRDGLWPHDADTNQSLYDIDGEWAGPLPVPQAALQPSGGEGEETA